MSDVTIKGWHLMALSIALFLAFISGIAFTAYLIPNPLPTVTDVAECPDTVMTTPPDLNPGVSAPTLSNTPPSGEEEVEDIIFSGDVLNSLSIRAEDLVKKSECWQMNWEGIEEARAEYVTILETSKDIQLSYIKNREFEGFLAFELKEVAEPLAYQLIPLSVDLDEESVVCSEDKLVYDWTNLVEVQDD